MSPDIPCLILTAVMFTLSNLKFKPRANSSADSSATAVKPKTIHPILLIAIAAAAGIVLFGFLEL